MPEKNCRRVNSFVAAAQLVCSAMLLAGCAGIAQPAYVEDVPKAKAQDCQSGQTGQDCRKTPSK
jgi:PBP1b-binding outer membrane lipoprotein LpoB